ncbi:MAG TPA: GtrA family protein [Polyangiaceae bacterium]|nr:GtrA family protein [Polyangiaceae bacterium]
MWAKAMQLLRAGIAGIAATASDVATLALLVSVLHVDPRVANVPALVVGGVVNFVGNRHFAFRAQAGHVGKQAAGYTAVELVALALNGLLYDIVLRLVPGARPLYWLVRLATSHAVFLGWSYPLWGRVFRVQQLRDAR